MAECKRCGSTETVKNGVVRGKQRYLCKRCCYHFIEGDQRENKNSYLLKTLCKLFRILGVGQCRTIGVYLKRDASLIHRWMDETSFEYKQRWKNYAHEFKDIYGVFEEIKQGGVANGKPILMADNVIDDLYVAIIVQPRDKR